MPRWKARSTRFHLSPKLRRMGRKPPSKSLERPTLPTILSTATTLLPSRSLLRAPEVLEASSNEGARDGSPRSLAPTRLKNALRRARVKSASTCSAMSMYPIIVLPPHDSPGPSTSAFLFSLRGQAALVDVASSLGQPLDFGMPSGTGPCTGRSHRHRFRPRDHLGDGPVKAQDAVQDGRTFGVLPPECLENVNSGYRGKPAAIQRHRSAAQRATNARGGIAARMAGRYGTHEVGPDRHVPESTGGAERRC